jgi:hypothetical protein
VDDEAAAKDLHCVDGRDEIDDGNAGSVRREVSEVPGVGHAIDRRDSVRGLRLYK